jgi:hypothetical protein
MPAAIASGISKMVMPAGVLYHSLPADGAPGDRAGTPVKGCPVLIIAEINRQSNNNHITLITAPDIISPLIWYDNWVY